MIVIQKKTSGQYQKGFTLIELMIAICIIGILAAIALPQFKAYRARTLRMKGYTVLGMIRSSQAALFYDLAAFGSSNNGTLPSPQTAAMGTTWDANTGPIAPAGNGIVGAQVSSGPAGGEFSGFPIDIPQGVICRVDTNAIPGTTYIAISYTRQTNRIFGVDYETQQTVHYIEDEAFVSYTAGDVDGEFLVADETTAYQVSGWRVSK
jgi:type IV pilus assembly protein PilA